MKTALQPPVGALLAMLAAAACSRSSAPDANTSAALRDSMAPVAEQSPRQLPEKTPMTFKLNSAAFLDGGAIPIRFSCEGPGISPPLEWSGAPATTRSFALIVDDPDAPDPAAPKMTFVHWVAYDIPATVATLAEGAGNGAMPPGSKEGMNGAKKPGYTPPCPPIGRHRYFFKLSALDTTLSLTGPGKDELLAAMKGHVVAEAQLMGTYQKSK